MHINDILHDYAAIQMKQKSKSGKRFPKQYTYEKCCFSIISINERQEQQEQQQQNL